MAEIKPQITKRPESIKTTLFLITTHMITSLISQRARAAYLPEDTGRASCSNHHNLLAFLLTTGKVNTKNGG